MNAKKKEIAFEGFRKGSGYTIEGAVERLNEIIYIKEDRLEQRLIWPEWNKHILTWFMSKLLLLSHKHNI